MKQFFDERQTQTAEHLGTISFYVIFLVSITAILIQLTFFSAPLQNVLGETAAVLTGGLVYLSGCIKNGLWSSDKTKSSWRENLILSLVCSGIFSIFYGFSISRKASADTAIGKYVCFFFIGITLISFIVTTLLGGWCPKTGTKTGRKVFRLTAMDRKEAFIMKNDELIPLYTAKDNLEAAMIADVLETNGIAAVMQDESSMGILNLYGGFSKAGIFIYVTKENYEKAKELLEGMGF